MPIDYSKIKRLTAREIVRALEKDGFERRRRRSGSSHRRYVEVGERCYHRRRLTYLRKRHLSDPRGVGGNVSGGLCYIGGNHRNMDVASNLVKLKGVFIFWLNKFGSDSIQEEA